MAEQSDADAASEDSDGTPDDMDDGQAEANGAVVSGSQEHAGPAAPFDVMLTCYTLFERDTEVQRIDRGFLKSWSWSHLILDEAHAVSPPAAMPLVLLVPQQGGGLFLLGRSKYTVLKVCW